MAIMTEKQRAEYLKYKSPKDFFITIKDKESDYKSFEWIKPPEAKIKYEEWEWLVMHTDSKLYDKYYKEYKKQFLQFDKNRADFNLIKTTLYGLCLQLKRYINSTKGKGKSVDETYITEKRAKIAIAFLYAYRTFSYETGERIRNAKIRSDFGEYSKSDEFAQFTGEKGKTGKRFIKGRYKDKPKGSKKDTPVSVEPAKPAKPAKAGSVKGKLQKVLKTEVSQCASTLAKYRWEK